MAKEDLLGYQNTKESKEARPVRSKSAFFMHFYRSWAQIGASLAVVVACTSACPKDASSDRVPTAAVQTSKNWQSHLKERAQLLDSALAQMQTTHQLAQKTKAEHRNTLARFQHFQNTMPPAQLQTLLILIQSRSRERAQKEGSRSQVRVQQAQAIDETWKRMQEDFPEPFPQTAYESGAFQNYVKRKQQMKALMPKYQKALTEIARVEQAVVAVKMLEANQKKLDAGTTP